MQIEGNDAGPIALSRLKVLIADDHSFFRLGLKSILKDIVYIRQVVEVATGEEVIKEMSKAKYDLVFLDIEMPGMDGIQALRTIRLTNRYTRVIALSMHSEERYVYEMHEANVNGFLRKDTDKEELERAIETVMSGDPYYSPSIEKVLLKVLVKKDHLANGFRSDNKKISLTPREEDVLRMVCQQYSSVEIAQRLYISEDTVKGHRLRLIEKTRSKNLVGMVLYAVRNGLYKIG